MEIDVEIWEEFEELSGKLDKRSLTQNGEYKDSILLEVLLPFQIGVVGEVSAAWVLFRCRAKRWDRYERFVDLCQKIMAGGWSSRMLKEETGFSVPTILKLTHKLRALREKRGLGEILCPCGEPNFHQGWCRYRFSKSLRRQEFMKNWHNRNSKH